LDLKELRELLQLLEERDVAEFELEESGVKLRIKKASANHAAAPPAVTVVAAAPPAIPAPVHPAAATEPPPAGRTAAEPPAEEGLVIVKSPIVGTFYRAPDPNSAAFVNVGDSVKVGQVLCIIEAMKLMNEIESEVAGEIVKIHPDSGQPVQYGDALFTIRPSR
jgi:acetyl-CoA carboxylase biotin carboxyl carrier protein